MYGFFGLDDIYEWLGGLVADFFCMLVGWFCFVLTFLTGMGLVALKELLPVLPQQFTDALAGLGKFAGAVDCFVPVAECTAALGIWMGFMVGFLAFRWIAAFTWMGR